MAALIIDTSGKEGVVALASKGKLEQTMTLPAGREMSKHLFSVIASLCLHPPDFIAVGKGPGTFTGTRVGAMAAQTLAYGWNIGLVCFCSTLLPDLTIIAQNSYQSFLQKEFVSQIELVYISPKN